VRSRTSIVLLFALTACTGTPTGEPIRIKVPRGASISQVADTLSRRGILRMKPVFKLYTRINRNAKTIHPGTYAFRVNESWDRMLEDLRAGNTLKAKFVIPEGWSLDRIAARMARFTQSDSSAVLDQLIDSATVVRHGVPGPTLEGYLYPATYELEVDAPVDSIVKRLVARYRKAWSPERQARADSIGMSEREVVTLASIVEKEAKQRTEMPQIASVYRNRLRIGIPLQADPTVQYALGSHRARLVYADIRRVAQNPYNTYANRGLPPGPIGSPSEAAIDAVLTAPKTEFLYFVAQPTGTHTFTRSLAEHNRAKLAARRAWEAADTVTRDSRK
jgi:UPF0755 protein